MSRLFFLIPAGAILLSTQTTAQTPVGGPSLGFVFDVRGQALRPILGIPGSSIFGDLVPASTTISRAAVSLRQNLAIVNDGAWKALTLAAPVASTVLPNGLPANARVAVSESGGAAAFYDSDNSALSVVIGIPASSMAASSVSLDALPGPITAMAVSDDGALLLSASIPEGGETLFRIGPDGSTRQLASLQGTASILLWNHGASALVVDRPANKIWQIQDPAGSAAITLLASDADGVSSPAGAALSTDGKQLWIANAGSRSVLGIDTNTRATVSLNCGFDLTTLLAMADSQIFRLNELDGGPLWILDASPGADPRVVFVPAPQPATTSPATTSVEASQ